MFDDLFKDMFLRDWMRENLEQIFEGVTLTLGEASEQLALSPSQWNPSIWGYVTQLTQQAILPIASIILAFVLFMEIYTLMTDRNNHHEIGVPELLKLVLKMGIAYWVVSNTFTLLLSVFDITAFAIGKASGIVSVDGDLNLENIDQIMESLEELPLGEYIRIWLMTCIADNVMWMLNLLITLIIYGRMIEIYMYCSVATIPAAAITSRDMDISKNFIKTLCALGLQGFLIMFCLGIYSTLVNNFVHTEDIEAALFEVLCYALLLGVSLFKTSGWAKSMMNSH